MITIISALWLGILTSISPCPLAGNIAAVSFIGRKIGKPYYTLLSGLIYTLGRTLFYTGLGVTLSYSLNSIPLASNWLQTNMVYIAAPLMILLGLIMVDLIKINLPKLKLGDKTAGRIDKLGLSGALIIGFLFAAMLCPISAAFFFSNLIQSNGNIFVLITYGIGTGLPIILFAVILAFFTNRLSKIYKITTGLEKYTRLITGLIFIIVGIYYIFIYMGILI
jgi:cytochrome c biogenesis protein CcdA